MRHWRHLLATEVICIHLPLPEAFQRLLQHRSNRTETFTRQTPLKAQHTPPQTQQTPTMDSPIPLPRGTTDLSTKDLKTSPPAANLHCQHANPLLPAHVYGCTVSFNCFLGTGHYFFIPVSASDSIYVQDKFISISFFQLMAYSLNQTQLKTLSQYHQSYED